MVKKKSFSRIITVMAYDTLLKKEAQKWKDSDITLNEFIDRFFNLGLKEKIIEGDKNEKE